VDAKPAAKVPKPVSAGSKVPPKVPEDLFSDFKATFMEQMMVDLKEEMMTKLRAEFQSSSVHETVPMGGETHAARLEPTTSMGQRVKSWYAVINGKGGVNSVFPEWIGGAAPYVTGISGALSKKFNDFNAAWEHVESHLATVKRLQDEDQAAMARRNNQGFMNLGVPEVAPSIPGPPIAYPRPPLSLIGPDPSVKKEDEIFGFEYGSELETRTKMGAPGLSADHSKALVNAVADVVALPGGFKGGSEEKEGSDIAMMSAALEELVHQGRSSTEGALKSDLQWRWDKRTALRTVRDPLSLTKRLRDLLKLRDQVLKNMIRATVNVLKRAGWTDEDAINAWAIGGYYTKMVRDSMDAWIALHQHFLGLATTERVPWSYVQVEIDHHVDELEMI
jgi:hypothetical protein